MTYAPLRAFSVDRAQVEVYSSKAAASQAAAAKAVSILRGEENRNGKRLRIVVATGNSQSEVAEALAQASSVDWSRVEVFHMDEYVGMPATHPASFRRWIKTRLVDLVHPGQVYYLEGDAADVEGECRRYGRLLQSGAIDVCFLGFGENGHIAFNDPPNADFADPPAVKKVHLDERCRLQQVGEGHFPDLESVPHEALTATIPLLMSAKYLICCVPERRKAEAVRGALEGPISTTCPASVVRTHPRAFIYLDRDSASLLSGGAPAA